MSADNFNYKAKRLTINSDSSLRNFKLCPLYILPNQISLLPTTTSQPPNPILFRLPVAQNELRLPSQEDLTVGNLEGTHIVGSPMIQVVASPPKIIARASIVGPKVKTAILTRVPIPAPESAFGDIFLRAAFIC
jgi:hypothetical protein